MEKTFAIIKPDAVEKGATGAILDRLRGAIGFTPTAWLGLIAFAGVGFLLTWVPFKRSRT